MEWNKWIKRVGQDNVFELSLYLLKKVKNWNKIRENAWIIWWCALSVQESEKAGTHK